MKNKPSVKPSGEADGLVHHFFHSLDENKQVEWQGFVRARPEPGWYLCQLFDWLMGEQSVERLVRIEDMKTWLFYPDADAMTFSYEHGTARGGGPYRKKDKDTLPQ